MEYDISDSSDITINIGSSSDTNDVILAVVRLLRLKDKCTALDCGKNAYKVLYCSPYYCPSTGLFDGTINVYSDLAEKDNIKIIAGDYYTRTLTLVNNFDPF